MMHFFDFHHHHPHTEFGIYNLNFDEEVPGFPFSAGIHPISGQDDFEARFQWLKNISSHKNCVAIGECGLDGTLPIAEENQRTVFQKQIELASQIGKPLIIHCVRKFPDLIKMQKIASVPMVIHGFNKRKTIADELLQHHFYFSFGKSLLYSIHLQQFVKEMPANRIFLETDDEDFDITVLYELVAQLKNTEIGNLKTQIKENLYEIGITI